MPGLEILPSILSADFGHFVREAADVDLPEINYLHIDVMDGHFVPPITFGPDVVVSLKKHTRFSLDVHLMIENPDHQIPHFAEAGADIITIHQEAATHLHRSLNLIRECGARVGVALNPATPLHSIDWVLGEVDLVLIMSVNPGFGGQKFITKMVDKIADLRRMREQGRHTFEIEVDGGINPSTAAAAVNAGASFLVAGNAIFGQKDRTAAVNNLIEAIETGGKQPRLTHA